MNILITGAWNRALEHMAEIESAGHKVFFMQCEKDALPCGYDEIEGVVCNGLFLHHPLGKFTRLKFIQLTSAGFDRVPTEEAAARNIAVYNAKGVYSIPMAESALCGVLQILKQSRFFYKNQKAHIWEKHRGLSELTDKTVCIVGSGCAGTECAKRFGAFGCRVVGIDTAEITDGSFSYTAPPDRLDEALKNADIVVLTLPLTKDTHHLINADRLRLMKKNAVIVNIARGALVDTKALTDALCNKLIGGAVLDVFEDEPLSGDSLLWDMDNVVITPHVSFIGDGNDERLKEVILSNLQRV